MPLKGFICPDGGKCSTAKCLAEGGCRMNDRCASRSFLKMAADERPWTGVPSTTQLLKGTMEAFLEITKDYYIKPADQAKRIFGTVGHKTLETSTDECSSLEMALRGFYCGGCGKSFDLPQPPKFCSECGSGDIRDVNVTGILDVLEQENGVNTLLDNKFVGSYRMARALGLTGQRRATGQVYKSGARAGLPRMTTDIIRDLNKRDIFEWILQLNHYRVLLAKRGIAVHKMRTQCFVRDAGDWVARQRGITQNMYMIDIPRIPDETVERYFKVKAANLVQAIVSGKWDTPCTMQECWDGIKCARYCSVAEFCSQGQYFRARKEPLTVQPKMGLVYPGGFRQPWIKKFLPI